MIIKSRAFIQIMGLKNGVKISLNRSMRQILESSLLMYLLAQGRTRAFVQGGTISALDFCAPPLKPLFEKNIDTFSNYVQVNYSITG